MTLLKTLINEIFNQDQGLFAIQMSVSSGLVDRVA